MVRLRVSSMFSIICQLELTYNNLYTPQRRFQNLLLTDELAGFLCVSFCPELQTYQARGKQHSSLLMLQITRYEGSKQIVCLKGRFCLAVFNIDIREEVGWFFRHFRIWNLLLVNFMWNNLSHFRKASN